MSAEQPQGIVTLVFTDIEGSTRLLSELGQEAYRRALGEHRRLVREACGRHDGYEVDCEGDAFFYAFSSAAAAVAAVAEAQRTLTAGPVRIRVGIHTGKPGLDPPKYVGLDVHQAARIMSVGHGGQALLSKATRELIEAEVLDLGEHRLKDIERPVWLYQLGNERFPPLRSLNNTNLPTPASSFLGRETELAEAAELLGRARLLTVSGPGGAGKTRFAIELAARQLDRFPNGVFWVPLAALRDPALVIETVTQELGAKGDLAEHIGERQMLLVLDNLEQVIAAAPRLAELLTDCPNLRLLVTSRQTLRTQGELEYQLPPLMADEGVQLLCARAQLDPSEAIRELCARLDGLPLAIELAAARTKLLAPEQLLDRLRQRLDLLKGGRDADPRQQTLRATIEWSYELLAPEEQQLFARLAVFAGGCSLEAAEQVAGADLDTLEAMLDKSLLRRTGDRYRMLETIREYAQERLEELDDTDDVRDRHAALYLALARAAEVGERGPDQTLWWDRLEAELDNVRAVLDRARALDDVEQELELAALLKRFWTGRGHLREGMQRLKDGLDRGEQASDLARARAFSALGLLTQATGGDVAAFRAATLEALELYKAAGDRAGVARMTNDLGAIAGMSGDWADGRELFERARRLSLDAGDLRYASIATINLADLEFVQGNYVEAARLGEECLRWIRGVADPTAAMIATLNLAWAYLGTGRHEEARTLAITELRADPTNSVHTINALEIVAIADVQAGRLRRAATLIVAAARLQEEAGFARPPGEERLYRRGVESLTAALGVDETRALTQQGVAMSLGQAIELAVADSEPDRARVS